MFNFKLGEVEWILLLTAIAAGAVDVISFAMLGGVFASAMTGNFALLAYYLAQGDSVSAMGSVVALSGFVVGCWAGVLQRRGRSQRQALTLLMASETGLLLFFGFYAFFMPHDSHAPSDHLQILLLSVAMDRSICPIVKRIWTPSWVFFSTAWTCWLLAAFYAVIDVIGLWHWAFPLVVVGMNSIAMYLMAGLIMGWVRRMLEIHERTLTGAIQRRFHLVHNPDIFSGPYGHVVAEASALLVLWLICLWMYRRKIFLKV